MIKGLKAENPESSPQKDFNKELYKLLSRLGLRKSVHFIGQSQYEFNSLKESLPELTLVAVFIRILYNEKLLTHYEISKFKRFLQNLPVIDSNFSPEKSSYFFSLVPLRLSSVISEVSIDGESEFKRSKQSPSSKAFAPSPRQISEESKLSPQRLMKIATCYAKSKLNKEIKRELEEIDEFKMQEQIFIQEKEKNDSKSSTSQTKLKRLKKKTSLLKLITQKSINQDLNASWGKNEELCYSTYTVESIEKSPIRKESDSDENDLKRSFVKKEGLFLVRQHSL